MTPRIVAFDLALAAAGIARSHNDYGEPGPYCRTVKPRTSGHERLHDLTVEVAAACRSEPHLAVIERPFIKMDTATVPLLGLHGIVTQWLWYQGIPYVYVSPMTRAVYATGDGKAGKEEVTRAVRLTYGHLLGGPSGVADHNAADATVLLCLALDAYGHALAEVPDTQRRATRSVVWPELREVNRANATKFADL